MRYLVLLALVAAALTALAQPGPGTIGKPGGGGPVGIDPYDTLVNIADQIVLGTVTDVGRVTDDWGNPVGRATLRVDGVLKGAKLTTASFTYPLPPEPRPGQMIAGNAAPIRVNVGDQRLYFLQRGRGGYALAMIYFGDIPGGIQPAADVEKVTAKLKAVTVEAVITGTVGPFYFDQQGTVTVTVRNTGKAPVQVLPPTLKGFFYSPRMDAMVTFRNPEQPGMIVAPAIAVIDDMVMGGGVGHAMVLNAGAAEAVAIAEPGERKTAQKLRGGFKPIEWIPLQPGEEKALPVNTIVGKPASWAVLSSDLYLFSVISLTANLQVQIPADNMNRSYTISTPWKDALVGYPLPKEALEMTK